VVRRQRPSGFAAAGKPCIEIEIEIEIVHNMYGEIEIENLVRWVSR
jgi:hypothetical protein